MTNLFDIPQIVRVKQLLADAQRIVVFTHLSPDGDAMGSSLAMYHWLKLHDKQAHVVVPNAFPAFLAWLPGAEDIIVYENDTNKAQQVIDQADLHICLDFNEPNRIGPVGKLMLQTSCPKILIDHHLHPDSFPTETFSYPPAAATCELVYRFFWQMADGVAPIGEGETAMRIAMCLYTGLMTDTGNFAFNSNDPDLYEIVAELMRNGIDKDSIYNAVFNQYSENRMRLMGYSLHSKMRVYPEYHAALIAISDEELAQFDFQPGDTEGLVNMPLQISDVYYSLLLREDKKIVQGKQQAKIKVSLRSQGDRPVNVLAREVFNGGGHKNASGGDFYGPLNKAIEAFENAMPDYLKKD